MGTHIVEQGEHMSRLARENGLAGFETLWNHPQNAALKEQRGNPNVLAPGDEVFIPERQERVESGQTEERHRFREKVPTLRLRLRVIGFNGKPVASAPCTLQVEGRSVERGTDGTGSLDEPIEPTDELGQLTIRQAEQGADVDVPLLIGHLDPVDLPTGQQARLNNLGYFSGEIGTVEPVALASAVEEFQCDEGLKVDGVCGPATRKRLVAVHGS